MARVRAKRQSRMDALRGTRDGDQATATGAFSRAGSTKQFIEPTRNIGKLADRDIPMPWGWGGRRSPDIGQIIHSLAHSMRREKQLVSDRGYRKKCQDSLKRMVEDRYGFRDESLAMREVHYASEDDTDGRRASAPGPSQLRPGFGRSRSTAAQRGGPRSENARLKVTNVKTPWGW